MSLTVLPPQVLCLHRDLGLLSYQNSEKETLGAHSPPSVWYLVREIFNDMIKGYCSRMWGVYHRAQKDHRLEALAIKPHKKKMSTQRNWPEELNKRHLE